MHMLSSPNVFFIEYCWGLYILWIFINSVPVFHSSVADNFNEIFETQNNQMQYISLKIHHKMLHFIFVSTAVSFSHALLFWHINILEHNVEFFTKLSSYNVLQIMHNTVLD